MMRTSVRAAPAGGPLGARPPDRLCPGGVGGAPARWSVAAQRRPGAVWGDDRHGTGAPRAPRTTSCRTGPGSAGSLRVPQLRRVPAAAVGPSPSSEVSVEAPAGPDVPQRDLPGRRVGRMLRLVRIAGLGADAQRVDRQHNGDRLGHDRRWCWWSRAERRCRRSGPLGDAAAQRRDDRGHGGAFAVAATQLCYFCAVSHLPVGSHCWSEYTAPVGRRLDVGGAPPTPNRLTVLGAEIAPGGLPLLLDLLGSAGTRGGGPRPGRLSAAAMVGAAAPLLRHVRR